MKMTKDFRNMFIPFCFAVLLVGLPGFFVKAGIIDAYTAQILTLGGINAIMAISVNIVCGITGQLSLGQAGFMAIGAYACIILTEMLGIPMPISIFLAGMIAAFFGFLIRYPTLQLSGDYLTIVTLVNVKSEP